MEEKEKIKSTAEAPFDSAQDLRQRPQSRKQRKLVVSVVESIRLIRCKRKGKWNKRDKEKNLLAPE